MSNRYRQVPWTYELLDWLITAGSAFFCLLLLPARLPSMELLGISPNWLAIWVVAYSVKRKPYQGILAGILLGFVQDSMTHPEPTHTVSLAIVGFLTACFQKNRYIQEDFISLAILVFGMTFLAETVHTLQYLLLQTRPLEEAWTYYKRIVLCSSILSSLWAPVIYFPLNLWWSHRRSLEPS